MKTTKFEPKNKLEVYAMDLRDRIGKKHFMAEVNILPTGNIDIKNAKLKESEWHTAPYDERYGGNWYIDEKEVPGKKKGTTEIVPIGRNIDNPEMEGKIRKSKSLNYDDWGELNYLINEVADHHEVTFNLKSATHTIRQGDSWGRW